MTRELQERLQSQQQQIQRLIHTHQTQEEQFSRQIAQKNEMIEHRRTIVQMDTLLEQKEAAIILGQRDLQLLKD